MFQLCALVITREVVRSLLRRDLPNVMIAAVFLAAGLGTMVLYRLRAQNRDRALLWFGMFATLYGLRLSAETDAVPVAVNVPEQFWRYLISAITYTICLPVMLLLWEIFPSWRVVLRWLLWAMAVFAAAGLVSDLVEQRPRSLNVMNSVIVLLALAAFLVALFWQRGRTRDVQTLRIGLLAFSLTVAINN
ncbi:MAG TPA: hypothetical protein VK604_25870, partial [Bryobacteraceae bacterium]|nr:hypothetical protein [Bryobacteraceae bacterium]